MIEAEEGFPHSVSNTKVTITQEGHMEDRTIREIKMTADKKAQKMIQITN